MFECKQYPNKLSLITSPLQGSQSVNVLILAGAGSRYERKEINGISHYLEHIFFKGGKKYKSAKEVSRTIDGLGGEMNAFTGKEYAGYYIKIASSHLEKAVDVLSDMLCHAQFPPDEIEKERGVILEEYNMYQDTPMYQVLWDFERLIFGDQPLGWDEIGTKELISTVQQQDFQNYKDMLYTPDNMVVSVAGNFNPKQIDGYIQQYFDFSNTPKGKIFEIYKPSQYHSQLTLKNKKTEQAHIVLGVEVFDYHDDRKYALQVLAAILGGNMSSRLFQSIREERGLAYYVQTAVHDYDDTGVLYTRSGVSLKDIYEVIRLIRSEYENIAEKLVTEEELKRAKEYLKGKLVLSFEDSEEVSHFYAKQKLLLGEISSVADILKNIDSVSIDDVLAVAKEIFAKKLFLSVIGPFDEEEKFVELLQ